MKTILLKSLVGSRAHGLHDENSDYDYRGVYVLPTREILSLGYKYKGSHFFEGHEDQTTYEIGHFLELAIKCNPSVLEVFQAPIIEQHKQFKDINNNFNTIPKIETSRLYGKELQDLFPYVWNPKDAFNAFTGYGLNQRKKMLDNHLGRWKKYAIAYLRTLWNLDELLLTGTFNLEVPEGNFKNILQNIKKNQSELWTPGRILDLTDQMTENCRVLATRCTHTPDIDKVNDYLINIRKEFFDNENT